MKNSKITATILTLALSGFSLAAQSYKFDFGSGKTAPGYIRVDDKTIYGKGQSYGFELAEAPVVEKFSNGEMPTDDACTAQNRGFFFSVDLPEGNYRVTVVLGNKKKESLTTVRAESRRLFIERQALPKGEFKTVSFNVNIRNSKITGGKEVRLNPREIGKLDWDDKLTLEFNDEAPSVCAVEIDRLDKATTLFLCGDSTVVNQDKDPWGSWGQMITRFFGSAVVVANHAESGQAANTSISSNRLAKVLSQIKPGDYLFVEFGHNDQKQTGEGVGAFTTYKETLNRYVQAAREKGAIPVLVTPVSRRFFDQNGHVTNTLGDFPEAVRQLAKEEDVALIDLNAMTAVLYRAWGPESSKGAFVHYPAGTFPRQSKALADNTHFNSYGAYEIAKCVLEGLKKSVPELAKQISGDYKGFDPQHPDDMKAFYLPMSPFFDTEKPLGN